MVTLKTEIYKFWTIKKIFYIILLWHWFHDANESMRLTFLYCHFFFTFHVCVHSTHYIAHNDILKDKTKALNYKIIDISSSKIKAIKLASTKGTKVLLAAINADSICNAYYNESLERHRVFNSIWNIKLPWNPFFFKADKLHTWSLSAAAVSVPTLMVSWTVYHKQGDTEFIFLLRWFHTFLNNETTSMFSYS